MQDGAPPLQARITHLNERFLNKWISYGSPYVPSWPPEFPNFTPLDFYLWEHLKTLVYRTPIKSCDQLIQQI